MNAYRIGSVRSPRVFSITLMPVFAFMASIYFALAYASTAVAANRYWVGGTGDWSDDGNHWATSSGGSPSQGNLPSSADNVFIDSNSGLGDGGTINVDTTPNCHDFNCSSGHTYAIDNSNKANSWYVSGSFTLETNSSFRIGHLCLTSTSLGETITTAGNTIDADYIEVTGVVGGWELQDDLEITGELYFENGTFDANDKNITATDFYLYSDAGYTPTIIMGSGTWEATGIFLNPWYVEQYSDEVVTIVPETSTIKISDASSDDKIFYFYDDTANESGKIYNNVWFTGAGTGSFVMTGSNTFNDFKVDTPPHTIKFTEVTTTTVTTFTVSGTNGNLITIDSVDGATQHTLYKATGNIVCDYLEISNSNATGGASWYAGSNSFDTANNDGWLFESNDRYWVGGTGDWSDDGNHWATESGGTPEIGNLPHATHDVFIDENSGFGGGGTITLDADKECLDFTAASGHRYTVTNDGPRRILGVHGSLTLESGLTATALAFFLRATSLGETITINGASLQNVEVDFVGIGGGWRLQDDLETAGEFECENGIFNANDRTITANNFYFYAATGYTPTVVMGSGTWEATGVDYLSSPGYVWYLEQYSDEVVTIIPGTSTIKFTDESENDKTFYFYDDTGNETGKTINDIWLTGAGTGIFNMYGSNTFNDFKVDTPPHTIKFAEGTTTTVTTFTVSGTAGNLITLDTLTAGEPQCILSASSGTVGCDYLDLSNSNAISKLVGTIQYDADALPENATPPFENLGSTPDTAEISPAGNFHFIASDYLNAVYYTADNNGDNSVGITLEWRNKLVGPPYDHGTYNGSSWIGATIHSDEGDKDVYFVFWEDGIAGYNGSDYEDFVSFDTSEYHTYRITAKDGIAKLYIDGAFTLDAPLVNSGSGTGIAFSLEPDDLVSMEMWLDYFYYSTDGAFAPAVWYAGSHSVDTTNNDGWVFSAAPTATPTPAITPTPTITSVGTITATPTNTPAETPNPTDTPTEVPTPTPTSTAVAANRYWVGGTGNWSDTGHWSTESGGDNGVDIPTVADYVFIDENSGFDTGGEITVDMEAAMHDFTATSGHTYSIEDDSSSYNFAVGGSLQLECGITMGAINQFSAFYLLSSDTGETVTTDGVALPPMEIVGTGSWLLQDDLTCSAFWHQNGNLDANDHNITTTNFYFRVDTGNTPTITMGSGIWEATGIGDTWWPDENNGEVLTVIPETSTIKLSNSSSDTKDFWGYGKVYNNIWITGTGTGKFHIADPNTFNDIKIDTPPHTVTFDQIYTTTVNTFTVSGTNGNIVTLNSDDGLTQFNLSCVSGIINCDYLNLSNSNATGGATWYAGSHSLDTFNNDGWVFAAAPTATPTHAPTPSATPSNYAEWVAQYPEVGEDDAGGDDPDGDGWTNGAEYGYWSATGEESDPADGGSGGQAIPLEAGWNLIGISADVCYYTTGAEPTAGDKALIPVGAGNYEDVTSIGALLDGMGISGQADKISGWHPAGGGAKEPVTWEGNPALDSLKYIAGGYGYWVKASEACTWKVAGKPRLKGLGEVKEVAIATGWNAMAPLFAKVHYEGTNPAAMFGSDETGREEEDNICDYLRGLVTVEGSGAPEAVEAMISYDSIFPFVRTYYTEVPPFLQTLKYAGPGMGILVKVVAGPGDVTMEYPAENGQPTATPTPTPVPEYRILHHFSGQPDDGANPYGSLVSDGTSLYGMTLYGGSAGYGTIFSMWTDGNDFTLLHNFAGEPDDGANPYGSLISDGISLYGMTYGGGSAGNGTIFSVGTDGTDYTLLHNFAGEPDDGANPFGYMLSVGNTLYGITNYGGSENMGAIFSIGTDGTGYTLLHQFSGPPDDGDNAYGGLLSVGNTLYGMTYSSSATGTIFSLGTSGTDFTLLHKFEGGLDDGSGPMDSLISIGNTLCGMTNYGGYGLGTIFSLGTDGTGYTLLHNFAGGPDDGGRPEGSLVSVGSTLYGMTRFDGSTNDGTIFSIGSDGTDFTVLHNFAGGPDDGRGPYGSLISDGTSLYGMTYYGGQYDYGAIVALPIPTPAPTPTP